jgi:SAM-dependent methyltransferase
MDITGDNSHSQASFYDVESSVYSEKRYADKARTYVQYFFNRRLSIVLEAIAAHISGKTSLMLLDIGCADGVMTRKIAEAFPASFSKLVGTDISVPMIEKARMLTHDSRISFFIKGSTRPADVSHQKFDIALGLGYLTSAMFAQEADFVREHLVPGGLYICSFAARGSLRARLKLKGQPYLKDYLSYAGYRSMLSERFEIIDEIPYGLFIPKFWALPSLGRALQPVIDALFTHIVPGLFHEKIYVLRLKP